MKLKNEKGAKMGTTLVIGGTGSLGIHLGRTLVDAGENVVLTYRRTFHTPALLTDIMGKKIQTVRCDITSLPDLTRAINDFGVDSIIHTAVVVVQNDDGSDYTCLQSNIMGTINVMEAAAIAKIKRVTYMSGGDMTHSAGEGEIVSIAASSQPHKKVCEILTLYYGAKYGITVLNVRGSGHFWGTYNYDQGRVQTALQKIADGAVTGKQVELPNAEAGEKVSLLYVGDIADGLTMLHLAPKPERQIYVVPGGPMITWADIVSMAKEFATGLTVNFGKSDAPDREVKNLPDVLAIEKEFGWKLKYGVKEGLREYIDWYKKGRP
jgi:nucleoside-diphosphate-sugar epimerase